MGGQEGEDELIGNEHPTRRNGPGKVPVDPDSCSGRGSLRGSRVQWPHCLLPGVP